MVFFSAWKLFSACAVALFGLAGLMDKLSSNELRSRLREIMTRDHRIRRMNLSEFTAFFIQNTFGRVFIGNHLSPINILKAGATTIVALFCVVIMYSVVHDLSPLYVFQFANKQPPNLSAAYVAILIGVVIMNDLISVLQTAMFMRFAASIRSFADMLFLGLCDLIITVNIFVFVFPIAMTAIFKLDDLTGRNLDIYVSASTLAEPERGTPAKQKKTGPLSEKSDEFERGASDLIFEEGTVFADEFKNFVKNNRGRVDELSIEPYQETYNGKTTSVIPTAAYVISNGMKLDDVNKTVWQALGVTLDDAQPPKADDILGEALRRGKNFSHGVIKLSDGFHKTSLLNLYFAAYSDSHAVQDQFLALPFLQPVTQSIKELLHRFSTLYMDIPHGMAKEFVFSCDSSITYEDILPDVSKCKTFLVSYIGPALRNIYYWARLSEPPIDPIMVSVFASTGLFLAVLFYASLVLYVLSGLILKAAWALGVGHGWFDLEKNPFAVAAGIILITGIPIGLIVGQVMSLIISV